jgi:ATP-dependent DNA helicase RecQ
MESFLQEEEVFVIMYVSCVKTAEAITVFLLRDGFNALPYYWKMVCDKKIKTQSRFMDGEVHIVVATSAFDMGMDKDSVSTGTGFAF